MLDRFLESVSEGGERDGVWGGYGASTSTRRLSGKLKPRMKTCLVSVGVLVEGRGDAGIPWRQVRVPYRTNVSCQLNLGSFSSDGVGGGKSSVLDTSLDLIGDVLTGVPPLLRANIQVLNPLSNVVHDIDHGQSAASRHFITAHFDSIVPFPGTNFVCGQRTKDYY